jgi:O-antigen/teichoic acid export membrane protein
VRTRLPYGRYRSRRQGLLSVAKHTAGGRLTTITIDQAVSSASNVLISVLAARALGVESFGYFGVVFLSYVTVQGAARALVGEPLLVRPEETRARPGEAIGTALVLGFGFAAVILAVGAITYLGNEHLGRAFAVLAVCVPLLLLQDLGRFIAFSTHRPTRAVWLDLTWLVLVIAAVGGLVASGSTSLPWFVAVWAGSGAAAGVLTLVQYRHHRVRLQLGWLRETWSFSWRYTLSFASMQSAALGVSVALIVIAGAKALGAVRGALLLLGPFVQFQAAAIAAGVAEVSRMAPDDVSGVRRHVLRTTRLTFAVAAVNATVLVLLPDVVGEQILGATWAETEPLLLPAGIQMVLLGLISGTRSALLGLRAVRRTTALDIGTTVFTLSSTVAGAIVGGAVGAFWFIACAQGVVAAVWWIAFSSHKQSGSPAHTDPPSRSASRSH